jgi:ribosomal protein S18 acetylase RimI-like enzyme
MTSLTLVPATTADLDRIMGMEATGFAAHLQETRQVYQSRIATFSQGSLLAHKNQDYVGCLFSEIWHYDPSPSPDYFLLNHSIEDRHQIDGTEIYISSMTVNSDYRGQGLGRELLVESLNYFANHFPQIKSAILLVNEHWTSAKTIYEQSGFQPLMTLDNFFGSESAPASGIVMRKFLR